MTGDSADHWLPTMTRAFMALDSSTHAINTAEFATAMEQVWSSACKAARCHQLASCPAFLTHWLVGMSTALRCLAATGSVDQAGRAVLMHPACAQVVLPRLDAVLNLCLLPEQVLPIFEKIGTVFLFARHEMNTKVRFCCGARAGLDRLAMRPPASMPGHCMWPSWALNAHITP